MKKKWISLLMAALMLHGGIALADGTGTANFYLNADDPEEIYTTSSFTQGEWIDEPENPARDGYVFDGWYTDAEATQKFSFNSRCEEDTSLYAGWRKIYVFEAEYTDLEGRQGNGYSGNTSGVGLIGKDTSDAGASNGYYVSCLYYDGAYLTFNITSDREVSDATIVLSLSAEFDDVILTDDMYFVDVNGETYNVEASLTGAYSVTEDGEHKKRPFTQHTIATKVHLNEGENVIELVTNNSEHMSGATMEATAPMVDCLILYTSAELTWKPVLSNIE